MGIIAFPGNINDLTCHKIPLSSRPNRNNLIPPPVEPEPAPIIMRMVKINWDRPIHLGKSGKNAVCKPVVDTADIIWKRENLRVKKKSFP